ncbi:MAG: sodium:solute symporter [Prevotella sp.]|jgi:SSS family solute:Na+ symporter
MNTIDFIIFILFTVGVVIFGCSFFRKTSSVEEFTSAGHSLPGWLVGMSIFATYVSSISYIGYPGKAFAGNWNAFVFSLSIPIASYFASKYFVPFYRTSGNMSAYAFLEDRFGKWARIYASACYLLTQIARMGSILYLLAVPMYILMGWNIHFVILATGFSIIVYSMLGGIKAVIWTDAIQGFLLIGGALLCLILLFIGMPDGPTQVFSLAIDSPQGNKFSLGSFSGDLTESTFWVCLIYGIFINLQNYGIDQNYVQRYHTARNMKAAKFSALFGGYLFIPVSALFFLIGTALYSYYTAHPGLLPESLAMKPDYVFPYFIVNGLPVGLRGLLIASIFAAGMSTVATSITSSSTIILADYFRPFCKKQDNRRDLRILHVASVIVGCIGICVAIAMLRVESIIDAWWTLSSIFSGGMLGLFLLGFVVKKARCPHALIGVLLGVVVIAWISLADMLDLPGIHLHEYLAIVFGTIVIFLTGFLMSIIFQPKKEKK